MNIVNLDELRKEKIIKLNKDLKENGVNTTICEENNITIENGVEYDKISHIVEKYLTKDVRYDEGDKILLNTNYFKNRNEWYLRTRRGDIVFVYIDEGNTIITFQKCNFNKKISKPTIIINNGKKELVLPSWVRKKMHLKKHLSKIATWCIKIKLKEHEDWLKDRGGECAEFRKIDFQDFDFSNVNLCGAILNSCSFFGANLEGANFGTTDLKGADFRNCDLRETCLINADLKSCDVRGAIMTAEQEKEFKEQNAYFTDDQYGEAGIIEEGGYNIF